MMTIVQILYNLLYTYNDYNDICIFSFVYIDDRDEDNDNKINDYNDNKDDNNDNNNDNKDISVSFKVVCERLSWISAFILETCISVIRSFTTSS